MGLGCSSDESGSNIINGFSVNGTEYSTEFGYTIIGNGAQKKVLIFSSIDRYEDSFVEVRGRFDLRYYGDNLHSGVYYSHEGIGSEGIDGVVEFDKNIIKTDGNYTSFGEPISYAEYVEVSQSVTESFISGKVMVNSVEVNSEGIVTFIDLDYSFKWDDTTIIGNYNGEIRLNP